MKILVVGTSPLPRGLAAALQSQHQVETSQLGRRLFLKIASQQSDLVLIWAKELSFLKLNKILEFLYTRFPQLNILICGATFTSPQRANILMAGVKDCLSDQVCEAELLAKIQLVGGNSLGFKHKQFMKQGFTFDFQQNTASYRGAFIPLNRKETAILHCLLDQADNIVLRNTLYNSVWSSPTLPQSNSLDVHISSIRRKIEKPYDLQLIEAVKGVGYRVKSN